MDIRSICIAKDEGDIIEETLRSAAVWNTAIYVLDNGSSDGTWETVTKVANDFGNIVPVRVDDRPFKNSMRGELFQEFRQNANYGDWWCRLDADEIYIDDPREFMAGVERRANRVWSASFTFYLTELDAATFDSTSDEAQRSDTRSVQERIRHYRNNWGELRFVKHEPDLVWHHGWPRQEHRPSQRRIRLKHYQFRSPAQIERRLELRRAVAERGAGFRHELTEDWAALVLRPEAVFTDPLEVNRLLTWRDRIVSSEQLHVADDLTWHLEPALMPPVTGSTSSMRTIVRRARRRARMAISRRPLATDGGG